MMQQEELAIIRAYQEAVGINSGASWTTCKMFIDRRVKELCNDQPQALETCWRTGCEYKTLGYDSFESL